MTTEHDIAGLRSITSGCQLLDLDTAHDEGAAVLVSSTGGALQLSASAAALIRFVQADDAPEVIAARFGARADMVQVAAGQLATRIRDMFGAMAKRRPPGFIAQRKLVSGARVAAWVRPLTALYTPWVAGPVVAASLLALALSRGGVAAAPRSTFALWAGFALTMAVMFMHELGHAAACQRLGAPVGDVGCALYLIYPALFCDVSSTWVLPRRARVMVDLGGIYLQVVATAALVALWWATGSAVLAATIRISTATMVMNLMPLGRLDGYWVLSDLLGVVNLRAQQRVVAAALWAWLRRRPTATPWRIGTTAAIAGYAVASTCFFASVMVRLLPQVVLEARLLPGRLLEFASAITAGEAMAAVLGLGRLASSVVIAGVALMAVRELGRATLRAVRPAPRER